MAKFDPAPPKEMPHDQGEEDENYYEEFVIFLEVPLVLFSHVYCIADLLLFSCKDNQMEDVVGGLMGQEWNTKEEDFVRIYSEFGQVS